MKTGLMSQLEQRLDAIARVKDTRQLIELQARLHDALNFYFEIKSNRALLIVELIFNGHSSMNISILDQVVEQQLTQFHRSSQDNSQQMSHIQDTIKLSVDHISTFLVEQVNVDDVHRQAMIKVQRDEQEENQRTISIVV
jgi:hypothetical protein